MLAAIFIAGGAYGTGLIFIAVNRLLDGLDGAIARRAGATALGGYLDVSLGLIVMAAIPFAFAIERPQNGLAAAFVILGILTMAASDLGARVYAQSAGNRKPEGVLPAPFAICEKAETYIIYALMTQVAWAFALFAYLYVALCFLTAGMRFAAAAAAMRGTNRP